MMSNKDNNNDLKGYYKTLGVSPDASLNEIKKAFRRRALELHPDKNKSPEASKQFQKLKEAHDVISDPLKRAEYDSLSVTIEEPKEEQSAEERIPSPIVCSVCGKIPAQPRYSIFYEVKSYIFATSRSPIQGIFCRSCADKKSLKATITTWLLGWWGFPWGPLYSIHALFVNLFGGTKPSDVNARILTYQAWVFARQGQANLARAVAQEAQKIAKDEEQLSIIRTILKAFDDGNAPPKLKDAWGIWGKNFAIQSLIMVLVVSTIGFYISSDSPAARTSVTRHPTKPQTVSQNAVNNAPVTNRYVRPTTAPNGQPWPSKSGYVKGYNRLFTDGLCTVTIDNTQNDSDVFVKLVSLDSQEPLTIRRIFISAEDKFTMKSIRAGYYDVRYKDLKTGALSRSESFQLKEIHLDEAIRYSNITMTLYKVVHGNMRTTDISEEEFGFD